MSNKTTNIGRWICVLLLLSAILGSCTSQQEKQEKTLVQQAKSIVVNNESSSAEQIENLLSSIRTFLSEYPDSERYSELSGYLDELSRCLDYHKVKEYTNQYEELSGKAFYDPNSAVQELDSFLDEFTSEYGSQLLARQPQLASMNEEIRNIKAEFEDMKLFFERDFSDLVSFNSEVRYNAFKYENSRFETVRTSWERIVDNQRGEQATKDMDNKVANFEEYLKNDAERICNYNFKDFKVDGGERIQTISMGSPFQHDSYNAKVCEGVFRVYLKGAYLGWDKGTAKISVKGMIVVTVDENKTKSGVEYRNMDFRIQETTGDL